MEKAELSTDGWGTGLGSGFITGTASLSGSCLISGFSFTSLFSSAGKFCCMECLSEISREDTFPLTISSASFSEYIAVLFSTTGAGSGTFFSFLWKKPFFSFFSSFSSFSAPCATAK